MTIIHNLVAMNAQRQFNVISDKKAKSTEKLSSGYKINRSADDAAGLAISEKMRRQIRGLTRASENVKDGISYVQTAEGALTEIHDMLQRMNELAVKAGNDTLSDDDRMYIDAEVQALKDDVDRIFDTTAFNEKLIWPKDSKFKAVIGYTDAPAVKVKSNYKSFDITNENIDELPSGYIKVNAASPSDISFSWTGYDGKKYETGSITLEDFKNQGYSIKLSQLYDDATADGVPANLYCSDGTTPLFDSTYSFSVSDYATDDDIVKGLDGYGIYTYSGISTTPEWATPSDLKFAGNSFSIKTAYKSFDAKQADAFDFDIGGDGTIEPSSLAGNMTSYPTATTVEEAKNDTTPWTFEFEMSGIGKVTGTISSASYTGNDGDDAAENTWWRWVYPHAPKKDNAYKAMISHSISPNLKGVMDALTDGYGASTPGLLSSDKDGCCSSGGTIDFYMSLKDSSGSAVGTQYFSFNVSSSDTEQTVFERITNSLNASTVMDYNVTKSNVTGGASISSSKENRNPIKEPVYKITNQFSVQAGADPWQLITITYDSLSTRMLGIHNTNTETSEESQSAISEIKRALEVVSSQRADFGAYQNRLEHAVKNIDNVVENTTAAESQIRDTDMAKEMVAYSLQNILAQAGTSVLSQANQMGEQVLSLLQ